MDALGHNFGKEYKSNGTLVEHPLAEPYSSQAISFDFIASINPVDLQLHSFRFKIFIIRSSSKSMLCLKSYSMQPDWRVIRTFLSKMYNAEQEFAIAFSIVFAFFVEKNTFKLRF